MAVKTAATAAALALVAGWYLFGSSAAAEDDDDFDEESAVPREQVLEIFYELKKQMPQKMAQVVQQLEQIRAQYPTIPQEQLTKLLVSNFDNQLLATQQKLFRDLSLEEADVDRSTHYYLRQGDKEVTSVVNDFRQLYTNYGGEVELDLPATLDEDKMCAAFDDYVIARNQAHEAIVMQVETLKRTQGQLNDVQQRSISQKLQQAASQMMEEALKKHDLTELVFQAAMKKFMITSEKFRTKFMKDQQSQREAQLAAQQARA